MDSHMFPVLCLAAALVLVAMAYPSPHRLAAAAAAPALAAEGNKTSWHVVTVKSLLPNTVCTAEATISSSALAVVHRHGPCSPLQSRSRGGGAPSHAEILGRDQDRVDAIRRKVAAAATAASARSRAECKGVSLLASWGKSLGTSTYVVSLRLGTPGTDLAVELDTGSVQSWVQCKPCADCYEQHDPVFDPAKSSTYSAIPCDALECQELGSGSSSNCSSEKTTCPYEVSYGDDSYTVGDLARDTLALSASPADTVPGFVFGCGHSNAGTFGEIDGLLGLGRGKASLPLQVAARYGARFSYCLPSSPSAAGYLSFGAGAAAPANAQFTEMVTGQDPTSYYLNLTGILVAGQAIKVPASVFATEAGTIIDSGTAFSRLPPSAYRALRSAFRRAMGGRYKRAPSSPTFDTCYDLTGHETVKIPSVALVFADGATVPLHPSGVLYTWEDESQACLAFVPNRGEESLGILGGTQQRTLAVIYDVGNQKIGFAAKGCA